MCQFETFFYYSYYNKLRTKLLLKIFSHRANLSGIKCRIKKVVTAYLCCCLAALRWVGAHLNAILQMCTVS